MGWSHIPDLEYSPTSRTDNLWVGHRSQPVGKVSVLLPPEDWLCKKIENMNLVLIEGYPSKSSEPGGLHMDQFLRPPKSQSRWYRIHPAEPIDPTRPGKYVISWPNDAAKINSAFSRIAKSTISNTQPTARHLSQDTVRKWEKAAKESSYICNQAAGFNRCITKIQDSVQDQPKILQSELGKGKSSAKAQSALDELQYLTVFNQNVSFAMGKSLQHLSDFTFTQMANLTLIRQDSYLEHIKQGAKPDTFSALRNCPLNGHTLFPDAIIRKAEDKIAQFESTRRTSQPGSGHGGFVTGHKKSQARDKSLPNPLATLERICQPGRVLAPMVEAEVGAVEAPLTAVPEVPRTTINTNDNYCEQNPVITYRAMKLVLRDSQKTLNAQENVNYSVVSPVHFATNYVRQPQKKGLSPHAENKVQIKSVNCVSFVDDCVFVPTVPNAHCAVHVPQVGGCLQNFWQSWARLGANPRVVSILKEGYMLPFKLKPPLVRHPLIVSGYANPNRNKFLREEVQSLVNKKAVEMVRVRASLAFFNRLFIVPKPNQKWRPVLDLRALNKFLNVKTFKMETPETIRISLQQGE